MTTQFRESQKTRETSEASQCRHYWIIDTPSGPVSKGCCRHCGEVRDFKNSPDSDYGSYGVTLDQIFNSGHRRPVVNLSDEVA